jgi:hypothetical protein
MGQSVIQYGIRFETDPTGYYQHQHVSGATVLKQCLQGCGILPNMMVGTKDTIADNLEENYQFGCGWQPAEGDVAEIKEGVFLYPDDPPLYPYMKAQQVDENEQPHGEVVWIYPYAQVCVTMDGKLVKRQRMD